jgi:hypothetical protein
VSTDTNFIQLIPGYNPRKTMAISDTINSLTRATKYYIKVQSVKNNAQGDVSVISARTTSEDVYVSGFRSVGGSTGSLSRAKYWVNGVEHELESDSLTWDAEAYDIFVSGNDVYVCGMDKRWGYARSPVYWKNGKWVKLSPYEGIGYAISVSGNDIYVAGDSRKATLWKNGETVFTDAYASSVKSMFVSGSDVHMVGHGYNQANTVVAKYWKNGEPVILSHKPLGGHGNSVFVSGSDVYVTGYDITKVEGLSVTATAKYWKNGSEVYFVDPQRYSSADGIYVDGNDLYISGSLDEKPAYWKNGVATILPSGKNCVTTGICVFEKDAYVCGYELTEFGTVAVYWKNGVRVELTSRYESRAMAMSIVVK